MIGLLNEGYDVRKFFVVSNSFHAELAYKFLNNLAINHSSIYSLLRAGELIPIFPNEKIEKLNLCYKGLGIIYNNSLHIHKEMKRRDFFVSNYLRVYETKNYEEARKEILLIANAEVKRTNINKVTLRINSLVSQGKGTEEIIESKNISDEAFLNWALPFKKKMSYLHRPILATFLKDRFGIKVLQKEYIQASKDSNAKFVLRSLTKENPLNINIDVFGVLIKKLIYQDKEKLENRLLESKIAASDQQAISLKVKNYADVIKLLDQVGANPNLPKPAKSYLEQKIVNMLLEIDQGIMEKARVVSRGEKYEMKKIDFYA
ncbi:hypothetical protein [Leptospira yasudae]|uniref:Uncharacterized protein n=1 Tax=Leptospira yasudae TaxID=2202201 RepID=A0A6N4QDX5_9LEPT|nr:hypothetical protein [Leptospira yasudae]TGL76009.1 hypothetical protein EHQ72_14595 [Leptospira yasudae]TGL79719.1 hypothetical protein EHQ83_17755 [Leptospira yasudae]TGL80125.1 hypothetical protein EHQ77_09110 [Leptospira yasudae]